MDLQLTAVDKDHALKRQRVLSASSQKGPTLGLSGQECAEFPCLHFKKCVFWVNNYSTLTISWMRELRKLLSSVRSSSSRMSWSDPRGQYSVRMQLLGGSTQAPINRTRWSWWRSFICKITSLLVSFLFLGTPYFFQLQQQAPGQIDSGLFNLLDCHHSSLRQKMRVLFSTKSYIQHLCLNLVNGGLDKHLPLAFTSNHALQRHDALKRNENETNWKKTALGLWSWSQIFSEMPHGPGQNSGLEAFFCQRPALLLDHTWRSSDDLAKQGWLLKGLFLWFSSSRFDLKSVFFFCGGKRTEALFSSCCQANKYRVSSFQASQRLKRRLVNISVHLLIYAMHMNEETNELLSHLFSQTVSTAHNSSGTRAIGRQQVFIFHLPCHAGNLSLQLKVSEIRANGVD